ncbi:EamA/RhaT family transporter [Paenalcaligenes niemegkensis]|nr:EamA/RhaT family transporter [Paenalcaligenes niemegkensis]MCQ9617184.1 EamA/RhaT family transporter [Paenalcaligenes niemegkensis]
MHLLIASIFCSVAVSIFLKLARRHHIDVGQAIVVNYLTAVSLCVVLLRPDPMSVMESGTPLWLLILLGFLLPTIFIAMARAVEHAGIVLADAAQRLSLVIPLLAAALIFGESIGGTKLIGVSLAILALICLTVKSSSSDNSSHGKQATLFLLAVWLGFGVIDILFKQLSKGGAQFAGSLVITFVVAGLVMLSFLIARRTQWSAHSLLSGIGLGLLNFGNIFYYIKAHQHFPENPTLVFSAMNIGVITAGTLVGAGFFKEKLSKVNMLGIGLAISAIMALIPR